MLRLVVTLTVLSSLAGLTGCSGRSESRPGDNGEAPPIAVCNEYANAYGRCLDRLGPHLGQERASELRATFGAARDEASRRVLEKQCSDSLARLTVACP